MTIAIKQVKSLYDLWRVGSRSSDDNLVVAVRLCGVISDGPLFPRGRGFRLLWGLEGAKILL